MVEMTLQEVQRVNNDTLFMFADYCSQNGLKYWIAYGTLLGAVRHKGVIPWDDDVDVWMPRADYEVFVKDFPVFARKTPYRFYYMGNDERQYDYRGIISDERTMHAYGHRITDFEYGLHIDVFPLDYLDESELKGRIVAYDTYWTVDLAHRLFLHDKGKYLQSHSRFHGMLYQIALATMGRLDFRAKMQKDEMRAKGHPVSSWMGILGDNSIRGYKAEWFEDSIQLEYEGRMLLAPSGYDEILKAQYGDYMTLPPESDRVPYGKGYRK